MGDLTWPLLGLLLFAAFVLQALLGTSRSHREGVRGALDELLGPREEDGRWSSKLGDRRVELGLRWREEVLEFEVSIEVRNAGPSFEIEVRSAADLDAPGAAPPDLVVGEDLLCKGDPRALLRLLAESQLDRLMGPYRTQRCQLREGQLVTTTIFGGEVPPSALLGFVREQLLPLARSCERTPVEVRLRETAQVAEHFVWTGQAEHARCPYCRADLDLHAPGLTACPSCDTVHHGECFDEHGGCTLLGCGAAPQRGAEQQA